MNDKMMKYTVWILVVLFTLLEVSVRTQISVRDGTHGFIQNNNEVRYLVDDISTLHKEFSAGIRPGKLEDARFNSWLRFDPEFLDFKERPLGVPHLKKVTLFNVNGNKSVDMSSISGNTVHFHSSFFEDKKIPPLGNTTFNVVFLGREEGHIESSLFIHTTEGSYKYQVKGASVASPYRLRPIVDVRVPVNVSFAPLIYMHNPHMHPIQITEVYSSGGEFHLELPGGEMEGPKDMWEIRPFETKAIIRVRFKGKMESNHTAYVRIKISNSDDVLVVPLEVEASSESGLFSPQGHVDFGVGGTLDPPREIRLLVRNGLRKAVKIHGVSASSEAVSVDWRPVKVPGDSAEVAEVAVLRLDWRKAHEKRELFGKIAISYRQGRSRLEIPYWATAFPGGLLYNASVTRYLVGGGVTDYSMRNFTLTNKFKMPVAITNVTLSEEARAHFEIERFRPFTIGPERSAVAFGVRRKAGGDAEFVWSLTIETNVSRLRVPLLSYDGRLTPLDLEEGEGEGGPALDLGLVACSSAAEARFRLLNDNPVDVPLLGFGTSLSSASLELLGDETGTGTGTGTGAGTGAGAGARAVSSKATLAPGQAVAFRVGVRASAVEGRVAFEAFVRTPAERLAVAVRFRAARGRLELAGPEPLFDDCFPGRRCRQSVRVRSSFGEQMEVRAVRTADARLSAEPVGPVPARGTALAARLNFEPALGCAASRSCYIGVGEGEWTRDGPPESDCAALDRLRATFAAAKRNLTLALALETSGVRTLQFAARVRLSWPRLADSPVLQFALAQVGDVVYRNVTLRNPADSAVRVHLALGRVISDSYVSAHSRHPVLLGERISYDGNDIDDDDVAFAFFLASDSPTDVDLAPGASATVRLGFRADRVGQRAAYLYVRNDLTALETVRLTGRAARPAFRFGNRRPGSTQPLLFELTERQLRDCGAVRRSFTARNAGDVPVSVDGFLVAGNPCEAHGFRVLDCAPFVLPPNGTRRVDVAFSPDFTLSRVRRRLELLTSLGSPVDYTLLATLPARALAPCAARTRRPPWEPPLYYACVSLMTFLLAVVVSVCFVESDRLLRAQARDLSRRPAPALDLRAVGARAAAAVTTTTTSSTSKGAAITEAEATAAPALPRRKRTKPSKAAPPVVVAPAVPQPVAQRTQPATPQPAIPQPAPVLPQPAAAVPPAAASRTKKTVPTANANATATTTVTTATTRARRTQQKRRQNPPPPKPRCEPPSSTAAPVPPTPPPLPAPPLPATPTPTTQRRRPRATFSDVVSRTSPPLPLPLLPTPSQQHQQQQQQHQHQKPTVYVEPTAQKPAATSLGPIGSKKSQREQTCDSFFTEPAAVWQQPPPPPSPLRDPWPSPGFWEPLCAPVGQPPQDYFWSTPWSSPWAPSQQQQQQQQQQQPPLAPPPGFARDDAETPAYDPFRSLSNIWAAQTPDFWRYSAAATDETHQ